LHSQKPAPVGAKLNAPKEKHNLLCLLCIFWRRCCDIWPPTSAKHQKKILLVFIPFLGHINHTFLGIQMSKLTRCKIEFLTRTKSLYVENELNGHLAMKFNLGKT